jgi:phage terminase large subunit-like protein
MIDETTRYAQEIVGLKIPANKKTYQAAKRHLDDLEKSKNDDYPYYFDAKKAETVINFISSLPNPDDGQPMKLVNFQAFIVGSLFGWKKKKDGLRRFTYAVISMARKQGKSIIVAGIALYMLVYEKNPVMARQIYTAANKRDQAKLTFNYVVDFLKPLRYKSKFFRKRTRIKRDTIEDTESSSFITPLSNDVKGMQGLNTMLGILDEQADSTDRSVLEAIQKSQRQQKQPLTIIISTVSDQINGWFHETEYKYVTKLLNGEIEDDTYFAVWYEQDNEEELADPKNWIKSNPILFDSKIREHLLPKLKEDWKRAQDMETTTSSKIYTFNMWQQASENSYINVKDWSTIRIDKTPDLYGRDVYLGLDLARVGDLSAVSWCIPIDEDSKFYVGSHAFVGTRGGIENKIQRDKIDYLALRKRGEVTLSNLQSGNIDDQQIIDYIYNFIGQYNLNVRSMCYDRYSANHIIDTFNEDGYLMVDVAQGLATLSEPTKQFRKFVQDKTIEHGDNRLLEIAVNNAIVKENNDAVILDKTMYRNKIDPLAALINAFTQAYLYDFSLVHKRDDDFYENEFHF